jgi:hypothetical protein
VAVPDTTGATVFAGVEYVVMLLLAPLDALVPIGLVAVTLNVYAVPAVRPVILNVPPPDWFRVEVIPPGEDVAV